MNTNPKQSYSLATGNIILVHNPPQWKFPFSSTVIWPLLRWFTGSYYHHVAIAWNINGEILMVEALGKGVVVTHFNLWLERAERKIKIIPLECEADDILPHLGKKYDRSSFFFYCLIKILFGKWFGKPEHSSGQMLYCFELAALIHKLPNWWNILPNEFIKSASCRYQPSKP